MAARTKKDAVDLDNIVAPSTAGPDTLAAVQAANAEAKASLPTPTDAPATDAAS